MHVLRKSVGCNGEHLQKEVTQPGASREHQPKRVMQEWRYKRKSKRTEAGKGYTEDPNLMWVPEAEKGLEHSQSIRSVAQSCPTLSNPMDCSMPAFPLHQQLPELAQIHAHQVSDAIQPSHPLSSPSPPAPNPSHHQSLFQWVSSSHQVAKVLEFQLQHQSFQWTPRTDLL